MSYEAWGEPDDPAFTIDELIEKGWISPDDVTRAQIDVLNERIRQQDKEGWSAEHDDEHVKGELAQAAACYALSSISFKRAALSELWPKSWGIAWFKPSVPRRDLVKAAALLIAEIERLDRAEAKARP